MTVQTKLAKRVSEERTKLHYTQHEVAEAISVSVRWYQKIESGKKLPGTMVTMRLLLFLKIDLEEFREEVGLIVPVSSNRRALALR